MQHALDIRPFQAAAVLLTGLGLLSLARRGHLVVTWLFAMSLFLAAGGQLLAGIMVARPADFAPSSWAWVALALLVASGMSWPALSYTLGRGDSGDRVRRALPYLLAWGAIGTAMIVWSGPAGIMAFPRGPRIANEIVLGPVAPWFLSWLLITLAVVITNFEATLRIATGTMLRRLKLMLLALIGTFATHVFLLAQALLYGTVPLAHFIFTGWVTLIAGVLAAYCLLRHRVSDLSVPAARPVIYSAITTTVIGGYLVLIAAVEGITRRFGVAPSSIWTPSAAAAALGVTGVAVFAPRLSRWVRGFVDRNLYAQRFDYRREWARVSSHLDPAQQLPELAGSVAGLVRSMVGASDVEVLLRSTREVLEPVASAGTTQRATAIPLDHVIGRALRNGSGPLVLERRETDIGGISYFVEGAPLWGDPPAVLAGLVVDEDLVGAILVGCKEDGTAYNAEEVDLIATMSHQLAHALWARRLSDELVEARELESFHRLASFVLHDLKTIVSGLSLTLRNAELHGENARARETALRSVATSVERMKELMERVARARVPGELELECCDVDDLVGESLDQSMDETQRARIRVVRRSDGPGELRADRAQMVSVLANLIRNACESMPAEGTLEIRVSSTARSADRDVVISVKDTGAGMDAEFMKNRLFHPFESTKKRGFGLGLYQSRGIVEAHGGRLEATSAPETGSEFRIILPVATAARAEEANR